MTRARRCPSAETARRQPSATQLLASSSESRSCAFVGEPLLNQRQPPGRLRSNGATAMQGVAQVSRDAVCGDFGNGPPQFVRQALGRVEARRGWPGSFRHERHHALDVEVRNSGGLRVGLDFDVVSDGEHARDFFHFAQNSITCLPRPRGSSHRGHTGDNPNVDAVIRRQVVGSQAAAYKSLGELIGFGTFGTLCGVGGERGKKAETEQECEKPAREVGRLHDRGSPESAGFGVRGIVRVRLNARHSQMGMDGLGEAPWSG